MCCAYVMLYICAVCLCCGSVLCVCAVRVCCACVLCVCAVRVCCAQMLCVYACVLNTPTESARPLAAPTHHVWKSNVTSLALLCSIYNFKHLQNNHDNKTSTNPTQQSAALGPHPPRLVLYIISLSPSVLDCLPVIRGRVI
jgi:hypothetical protein